jgi:hypothetical protein
VKYQLRHSGASRSDELRCAIPHRRTHIPVAVLVQNQSMVVMDCGQPRRLSSGGTSGRPGGGFRNDELEVLVRVKNHLSGKSLNPRPAPSRKIFRFLVC